MRGDVPRAEAGLERFEALAEEGGTVSENGDVVAELFDFVDVVRGEKDGPIFPIHEVKNGIDEFFANEWVESAKGFIENEIVIF